MLHPQIHPTREVDESCQMARPTVHAMDKILGLAFPVLDHGFIRVVDYMGTDLSITQAARVSYGEGTEKVSTDQGLINYLMRHWHSTPFEMCEIKLHVKLPVFVARQWIRHRTANVNEYSARYSILNKEFYIPEPEVMAAQSTTNNQGRGAILEPEQAEKVRQLLIDDANGAYDSYEQMYSDKNVVDKDGFVREGYGLARELARMNLPTNIYTQWYWKVDLHNLFHFLRLRMDSHSQYEIRVFADLIAAIVADWVPMAMSAFENYRLNSMNLSNHELRMVSSLLNTGILPTPDNFGMSKGEFKEFENKLNQIKGMEL